jgi:RNA polymerase sigma factor (sigma-70 family)
VTKDEWLRLLDRLQRDLQEQRSSGRSGGDSSAWIELRAALYKIAHALVPASEVEDVVQSALVRLQSSDTLRRVSASGSPQAYAYIMMRNIRIDAVRKARYQRMGTTLVLESEVFDPQDEIQDRIRAATVRRLIQELDDGDKELIWLRFWEDMTMADIARRLNQPYPTVAVRMFRLLRRLREQLGADDAPDPVK